MAKKKTMEKKTEEQKTLTPKEMRKQAWEAMQKNSTEKREEDVRKEWKIRFIKLKRQLDLNASLEDIMWLHFKAAGFASKELFDNGIKHFGYKI